MPIVVDTQDLLASEQADALITTLADTAVAPLVQLDDREPVRARMGTWPLGAAELFLVEATALSCTRTARTARRNPCDFLGFTLHARGPAIYEAGSSQRVIEPGELVIFDVDEPFEYTLPEAYCALNFNVPVSELDVSTDAVRHAGAHLSSSPLYELVRRHIYQLARNAEELSSSPVAEAVGSATISLVQALVASVAADSPNSRDVLESTLITQVREYIRQHLSNPDLRPDTIAAALMVSPRHLYRGCAGAGVSTEQLIITARLEQARFELAQPAGNARPIAVTARGCGFKDPTHFARRFRAEYGLLPSEWREQARQQHGQST